MRPRVFVTRRLPDAVEARLRRDYDAQLNHDDSAYDAARLEAGARDADAILTTPTERWDADRIARLPESVRIIATFSAGFEHLDLAACRGRGIVVTNTPDVLSEATAEVAMLCLLGAARRAWEGQLLVREGRWGRWAPTQLLGLGLDGKVLGIVGMGRIGQAVARRARGFGLEIHYYNRSRLPPEQEQGATYHATLESLLPRSRFLSLNSPGGAETRHLLDARTIELLPHGAVVVNTARGSLVDDEALIAALRSGRVFAAGLDVFEGEPSVHPGLLEVPNAVLTPHIASASVATRRAMADLAADNLIAALGRGPQAGLPPTPVNRV